MSDTDEKLKSLEEQVQKLANFIMEEVKGEPSRSEGAVDCAIRLLSQCYSGKERAKAATLLVGRLLTAIDASIPSSSVDKVQFKAFKDTVKNIVWQEIG